jgi:hypothetical protein
MECLANCQEFPMSDPSSELVEISKLNGDLKRNYARGRSVVWGGLLFTLISASVIWLKKHGLYLSCQEHEAASSGPMTSPSQPKRGHLRVPYYAAIGVMRRRILR